MHRHAMRSSQTWRPQLRAATMAPAVAVVWGAWLILMTGANLAAPLYAGYAERFGFSSFVLTLVFTTYAVALLPSLLVFGRLSDRLGRRPVMLVGLASAGTGLAVFAFASSTAWLFAARALQGLAVGMISGAATAALVELDTGGGQRPAMLAGLAQAGGSALGPLVTGVFATWLPEPLRLSFLAVLLATGVAAVLVLRLPEPARTGGEPWRIQRPRVPPEIAVDFGRVGLTAAVAWASVALYLSIVPSYASDLLHTDNLALLGAVSAIALAASCATLIGSTRRGRGDVRTGQAAGLCLIAVGLAGLALAAPLGSLAVLVAAALATGAGHGLAFLNAQDELNTLAPGERRGEVTAAFICCIYALVGGAVVAAGLLDRWASLSVAVYEVAVALAVMASAAAVWQRSRG